MIFVCERGNFSLCGSQIAALADYTLAVAHDYLAGAHGVEQPRYRNARSARAAENDRTIRELLFYYLQCVDNRRKADDRRAVLIVVKNRYIRALLELALDFKAARSRDILEIHSAERTGEQSDGVDNIINIF